MKSLGLDNRGSRKQLGLDTGRITKDRLLKQSVFWFHVSDLYRGVCLQMCVFPVEDYGDQIPPLTTYSHAQSHPFSAFFSRHILLRVVCFLKFLVSI